MKACGESTCEPVFILSCVRSGSTLLRCIVDTHPEYCSPGHLNLGALCSNLYNAAYYTIGKLPGVEAGGKRDALAVEEVRRVVSDLLNRYSKGKSKNKWCEKSTINIDYLDILQKVFPDARYICLYRNCLDVVNSCIKFNALGYMEELAPYVRNRPSNFVGAMIDNWLEKNNKLLAFERAHSQQCIRVNYESLVSEPERILAELFGFLGEDWDGSLVESVFRLPHDQGDGDVKVWFSDKITKDSVGNGTALPLASIPKELRGEVDILHQELGYPSIEMLYAKNSSDSENYSKGIDLDDFFNKCALTLERKVHDVSCSLRGCCKLVITGVEGGIWLIEVNESGVRIEKSDGLADCTISSSYKVFCEIVSGDISATQAYERGEIVGDGNVILALEFGRVLFSGV